MPLLPEEPAVIFSNMSLAAQEALRCDDEVRIPNYRQLVLTDACKKNARTGRLSWRAGVIGASDESTFVPATSVLAPSAYERNELRGGGFASCKLGSMRFPSFADSGHSCSFAPADALLSPRELPQSPLLVGHYASSGVAQQPPARVCASRLWAHCTNVSAVPPKTSRKDVADMASVHIRPGPLRACSHPGSAQATACASHRQHIVPGVTFAVQLHTCGNSYCNLFHLVRDNFMQMLFALRQHGIEGNDARVLLLNSDWKPSFRFFSLINAFTRHPILTIAKDVPLCVRFERLIVGGVHPANQRGSGCLFKGVRSAFQRHLLGPIPYCRTYAEPVVLNGVAHVPAAGESRLLAPRITLVVRTKVTGNHGGGRILTNLLEVEGALRASFPASILSRAVFEDLPVHKQWQAIARTDVLIGVHGAGLTNLLFLPRCGQLIELMPKGLSAGFEDLIWSVPGSRYYSMRFPTRMNENITVPTGEFISTVHEAAAKWTRCTTDALFPRADRRNGLKGGSKPPKGGGGGGGGAKGSKAKAGSIRASKAKDSANVQHPSDLMGWVRKKARASLDWATRGV